MNTADKQYNHILDHPGDKSKVIQFFTDEAKNFVNIKKIIDSCKSDEEFESRLYELVGMANFVRTSKLPLMRENYGLFQLRQKRYFDKLRMILLAKEQQDKKEEVK